MSAIFFGVLALCAGVFAFWIYERREIPIAGRRMLASARAASLALIMVLLWNPHLPAFGSGAGAGASGRWTLLDGSLSMSAVDSGGVTLWSEALRRARDRESAGDRIMVFSSGLEVPLDGLPDSIVLEPASRLAPALERVRESGSREVVVISDLRLSDSESVGRALTRLGMSVRFDVVGDTPRNVALPVADLPASVGSGDSLIADVAVRSMGTSTGDSILVEVREEGDLRASRTIGPPPAGRLTRLQLSMPPSSRSGLVRYEIRASLVGDVFPDDDARVRFVEVDKEAGGLVLVSLRPDWEPRFLMPVLEQVTGLPGRGFLRLSEGHFVPLSVADGVSAVVDDAYVQGWAETAEVLVVHAVAGDLPPWLSDALAGSTRSIVFLAGTAGAWIDLFPQKLLQLLVELRVLGALLIRGGERMDQPELEVTQKELLHEAGLGPLGLTGRLGDLPRFALLRCLDDLLFTHPVPSFSHLRTSTRAEEHPALIEFTDSLDQVQPGSIPALQQRHSAKPARSERTLDAGQQGVHQQRQSGCRQGSGQDTGGIGKLQTGHDRDAETAGADERGQRGRSHGQDRRSPHTGQDHRHRHGSRTRVRTCRGDIPSASAAATASGGASRKPVYVLRKMGNSE